MKANQGPAAPCSEDWASKSDGELAEHAGAGDLDAFGEIIRRHQALALSIAFSMCGRFRLSEELAHDAFVSAWRNLSLLKDKDRLKGWLCGIVRNLAREEARKAERRKRAETRAGRGVEASWNWAESPRDRLASAEEEAMVWAALEQIPEGYREPMVLYYRESQSTQEVARALEMTEEAVRQRLTRGRAYLKREVEASVGGALRRTAPGAAFRLGVLASISASASKWASAATVGAGMGVGSKALLAKAAGGVSGAALGTLGGLFGAWIGTLGALRQTPSVRARKVILRSFWACVGLMVAFFVGLYFLVRAAPELMRDGVSSTYVSFLMALIFGFQGALALVLGLASIKRRRILREEGLWDAEASRRRVERKTGFNAALCRPFVSRRRFLGVPLFHIAPFEKRWALGWIVVAPKAVGLLFGFGGISVGLIGVGGLALGGIAMAGLSVGLVAIGGLGIGAISLGGVAAGVWALGGIAAGWQEAFGGIAYSPTAAIGGVAYGVRVPMEQAQFAPLFESFMKYRHWFWALILLPALIPALTTRWISTRNSGERKPMSEGSIGPIDDDTA